MFTGTKKKGGSSESKPVEKTKSKFTLSSHRNLDGTKPKKKAETKPVEPKKEKTRSPLSSSSLSLESTGSTSAKIIPLSMELENKLTVQIQSETVILRHPENCKTRREMRNSDQRASLKERKLSTFSTGSSSSSVYDFPFDSLDHRIYDLPLKPGEKGNQIIIKEIKITKSTDDHPYQQPGM